MIELLIRCPRCKHNRKWISYKIATREGVFKKTAYCFYCCSLFSIKNEKQDNIIKLVQLTRKTSPINVPKGLNIPESNK